MSKPSKNTFICSTLNEEPWVDLPSFEDFTNWTKDDEIHFNQKMRQQEKWQFYIQAFDFITSTSIPGDYYEFGCHRGRTFRMALTEAKRHFQDNMNFYAFDSFQGMPMASREHGVASWTEGNLFTSETQFRDILNKHGIYTDRCHLIKGFYQDSLTPTLQDSLNDKSSRIAIVCVDCDVYESATHVFRFIEPFLQNGSVVYIDDFHAGYKGSPNEGVARAFSEFQHTSSFRFSQHLQIGWWGRSFIAYKT